MSGCSVLCCWLGFNHDSVLTCHDLSRLLVNAPVCVRYCSILGFFNHSFAASCSAWELHFQHCSLVSQILVFTCKVARGSSFLQLPSASKCCRSIFFSSHGPKYLAFSMLLLTVLQPQATDIYQNKGHVRYLEDWVAAVLRGKARDFSTTNLSSGACNRNCRWQAEATIYSQPSVGLTQALV